ncbi:hypothetical protein QUF58_03945 [Anaerolineales bacterium HSG24]|nr:hypothetical protein [Anaerolineales bacterium HSG24]
MTTTPLRWMLVILLIFVAVVVGLVETLHHTPTTHPDEFENVRGSKAKRHKQTGEVWEPDLLHKDHWEVYKNKKMWERGKRDRSVWNDGRLKDKF